MKKSGLRAPLQIPLACENRLSQKNRRAEILGPQLNKNGAFCTCVVPPGPTQDRCAILLRVAPTWRLVRIIRSAVHGATLPPVGMHLLEAT